MLVHYRPPLSAVPSGARPKGGGGVIRWKRACVTRNRHSPIAGAKLHPLLARSFTWRTCDHWPKKMAGSIHGSAVATSVSIRPAAQGMALVAPARVGSLVSPQGRTRPPLQRRARRHSPHLDMRVKSTRLSNSSCGLPTSWKFGQNQSKVSEACALEGVRFPLRTCVIAIRLRDLRRCLCWRARGSLPRTNAHTHDVTGCYTLTEPGRSPVLRRMGGWAGTQTHPTRSPASRESSHHCGVGPALSFRRRRLTCLCRDSVACARSSGHIRIRPPHSPSAPRVAHTGVSPRRRGLFLPYDLLRYPIPSKLAFHSHAYNIPRWCLSTPQTSSQASNSVRGPVHGPTAFPRSVLVSLDFPSVVSVAAARFFRKCYATTAAGRTVVLVGGFRDCPSNQRIRQVLSHVAPVGRQDAMLLITFP